MKKRLLVMYATYGTGHKSIAKYIEDYFLTKGEYEVMSLDILDYATSFFGTGINKIYNHAIYRLPWVWNTIYYATDNPVGGKVGAEFQTKLINNKKLKKDIKEYNPNIVIATHFLAAIYISKLKKNNEIDCHLVSIVTDYRAHSIWLDSNKSEDALIVNSIEEKRHLIKKGIAPKIIYNFGIPVSQKYALSYYDKSTLMKKFKLTGERPIILFYGGGGTGTTTTLPYLLSIIENDIDADIFFVCGKNKKLKQKALGMVNRHNAQNIRVLGFITNGPEYLTVSDFVITKPGGLTVTECLCFKKPMVLIKSVGGQERDNIKFLTKRGYALSAKWKSTFVFILKRLCNNNTLIDKMTNNLDDLNKEDAMKNLYKLVGEICSEK